MPISGEMRLRQIILALIALAGVWAGVLIQRSHHGPARAFAAGPPPPDFAAPKPKLLHVRGLSRPVASAPIVKATPVVHDAARRPSIPSPRPAATRVKQTRPAESGAVLLPDNSRTYSETPT